MDTLLPFKSPFLGLDHIELLVQDRPAAATELTSFFGGDYHPTSSGDSMMVDLPFVTYELKSWGSGFPRYAMRVIGNERTKAYLTSQQIEMNFDMLKKGGGPIFFDLQFGERKLYYHSVTCTDGVVVTLTLPKSVYDIKTVTDMSLAAEEEMAALARNVAWICKSEDARQGLIIRNPTVDDQSQYSLQIKMIGDGPRNWASSCKNYAIEPARAICNLYGIDIKQMPIAVLK